MDLGASKDHGLLRQLNLPQVAQRSPRLFRYASYFRAHDDLGRRSVRAAAATAAALLRESSIEPSDWRPRPRLIGGLSGRSGTTWLEQVLRYSLYPHAAVIGERHLFWKHEFIVGPERALAAAHAERLADEVQAFARFLVTDGFGPRINERGGITFGGLGRLLPRRVLLALANAFQSNLISTADPWRVYGDFYTSLFSAWTRTAFGRELPWISKEPSYGESADRVFRLMPDARLVVLVRDGRDIALSAVRAGWSADFAQAADRWAQRARPALAALQRAPEGAVLIVRFEQLCAQFFETMTGICGFLELPVPAQFRPPPVTERSSAWRQVLSAQQSRDFLHLHGDLVAALGYPE